MFGLMSVQAFPTARSIRKATSLLYLSSCLSEPIEQSVWRIATVWTVRGSNPIGGEIFHTRHGTHSTGGWVGRSLQ